MFGYITMETYYVITTDISVSWRCWWTAAWYSEEFFAFIISDTRRVVVEITATELSFCTCIGERGLKSINTIIWIKQKIRLFNSNDRRLPYNNKNISNSMRYKLNRVPWRLSWYKSFAAISDKFCNGCYLFLDHTSCKAAKLVWLIL